MWGGSRYCRLHLSAYQAKNTGASAFFLNLKNHCSKSLQPRFCNISAQFSTIGLVSYWRELQNHRKTSNTSCTSKFGHLAVNTGGSDMRNTRQECCRLLSDIHIRDGQQWIAIHILCFPLCQSICMDELPG